MDSSRTPLHIGFIQDTFLNAVVIYIWGFLLFKYRQRCVFYLLCRDLGLPKDDMCNILFFPPLLTLIVLPLQMKESESCTLKYSGFSLGGKLQMKGSFATTQYLLFRKISLMVVAINFLKQLSVFLLTNFVPKR